MSGRSPFLAVLAAALAGVACSQDGAVDVTWDFQGTEPASSGCGQHGVDSVVISGMESGGDGLRVVTLCTPGSDRVSVAPGTWTMQVSMLDAQGAAVAPADDTAPLPRDTVVVGTDAPAALNVHLYPPSSCADGVDNDHDGRVDAADPDCASGAE